MIFYENKYIIVNTVGIGVLIIAISIILSILYVLLDLTTHMLSLVAISLIGYSICLFGIISESVE